MQKIANLLHLEKTTPNLDLSYTGWIADRISDSPCLTTPDGGCVTSEKSLALLIPKSYNLSQTISERISILIQTAFVLRKNIITDFNWHIFRSLIIQAIEKRDDSLVKTSLGTFEALLEEHLLIFPLFENHLKEVGTIPPDGFIMNFSYNFSIPHPSQLDLSNLIVRAYQNNSPECAEELLNSVFKLIRFSFEKNDPNLFRKFIFEFYRAYWSSSPGSDNNSLKLKGELAYRLPWINNHIFDMYIFKHENSLERLEKLRPFTITYFSLCLHLLKCSAERCDDKMFDRVIEDLVNFLKHTIPNHIKMILDNQFQDATYPGVPYNLQIQNPTDQKKLLDLYNDIYDYKNLVYVITGSWLMYKVKSDELNAENVEPFIQKLINNTSDFRSLLDLYAMPGMADINSNRLGFNNWDWPHSPYPPARTGTDFSRWIHSFYEFLLLKKAIDGGLGQIKLEVIRQTQIAYHELFKEFLTSISDQVYTLSTEYQNTTWGLGAAKLDKAKSNIGKILSSWSSQSGNTPSDE